MYFACYQLHAYIFISYTHYLHSYLPRFVHKGTHRVTQPLIVALHLFISYTPYLHACLKCYVHKGIQWITQLLMTAYLSFYLL